MDCKIQNSSSSIIAKKDSVFYGKIGIFSIAIPGKTQYHMQ